MKRWNGLVAIVVVACLSPLANAQDKKTPGSEGDEFNPFAEPVPAKEPIFKDDVKTPAPEFYRYSLLLFGDVKTQDRKVRVGRIVDGQVGQTVSKRMVYETVTQKIPMGPSRFFISCNEFSVSHQLDDEDDETVNFTVTCEKGISFSYVLGDPTKNAIGTCDTLNYADGVIALTNVELLSNQVSMSADELKIKMSVYAVKSGLASHMHEERVKAMSVEPKPTPVPMRSRFEDPKPKPPEISTPQPFGVPVPTLLPKN